MYQQNKSQRNLHLIIRRVRKIDTMKGDRTDEKTRKTANQCSPKNKTAEIAQISKKNDG